MSTLQRHHALAAIAALVVTWLSAACATATPPPQRTTPPRRTQQAEAAPLPPVQPARQATRTQRKTPPPPATIHLVRPWRHGARHGPTLLAVLDAAEAAATPEGRRVLQTGRRMILDDAVVIRGSCWTYATSVYGRAGFHRKKRTRIYRSRKRGPYTDVSGLQPGDFLSYINHSYSGSEHSAIFVAWLDRSRKEALMMSYVGGKLRRPGGYRSYLLSHVYMVMRPRPVKGSAAARTSPDSEPVWDGGSGAPPS